MSLVFQQLFEAESGTYTYFAGDGNWEQCVFKLSLSRTIGLVCAPGGECPPLEAVLTKSGFDTVILQDGLKGLGGG